MATWSREDGVTDQNNRQALSEAGGEGAPWKCVTHLVNVRAALMDDVFFGTPNLEIKCLHGAGTNECVC